MTKPRGACSEGTVAAVGTAYNDNNVVSTSSSLMNAVDHAIAKAARTIQAVEEGEGAGC